MGAVRRLIDSNVLIAALSVHHSHHHPSFALLDSLESGQGVVSVHSLSEFYNISTRDVARGGSGMPPAAALAALDSIIGQLEVLSLDVSSHINALSTFAAMGGTGARLYDFLIGQIAVSYRIPAIITWNVRHMASLFPALHIATPEEALI